MTISTPEQERSNFLSLVNDAERVEKSIFICLSDDDVRTFAALYDKFKTFERFAKSAWANAVGKSASDYFDGGRYDLDEEMTEARWAFDRVCGRMRVNKGIARRVYGVKELIAALDKYGH